MRRYAGHSDDPAIGGGSYITSGEGPGGERFNFKVVKGWLYARFQPNSDSGGFDLSRIDPAAADGAHLDGVRVIFVAKQPRGGQRVVGWYDDGRAYAAIQDPGARQRSDIDWNIRGSAPSAVLLPVAERNWEIPTGKGGMATTHVRYAYSKRGKLAVRPWMTAVLKHIDGYDGPNLLGTEGPDEALADAIADALSRSGHPGFLADPKARKAVEDCAMDAATTAFAKQGVVADEHVGNPFDLSVTIGGKKKYVEVKGTTGGGEQVIMTAGEVRWARKHQSALFVLRGVKLSKVGASWKATGGDAVVIDPWVPASGDLAPLAYQYRVPKAKKPK